MNNDIHSWMEVSLGLMTGSIETTDESLRLVGLSGSCEEMLLDGRRTLRHKRLRPESDLDAFFSWLSERVLCWEVDRTWSFDRQLCIAIGDNMQVFLNLERQCVDKALIYPLR